MFPVTSFVAMPVARRGLSGLLLIMELVFCAGTHAEFLDPHAEISYTFDDNVTRASERGTKLADRSYSVNLSQPIIYPIVDQARAFLICALGGEVFDRNKGLSHVTGTLHGELQYRNSSEIGTPTIALFARVAAEQYQSAMRDGFRYSAGISMRQAVTDRIRFSGALAHNERNSKNAVFDNKDNSARFNLDYSPGAAGTIYLGGEYRRGDSAISGSELWSEYNPNAYTLDDAFPGMEIYSFRFDGTTVLSTLGYNLEIGPRDAIDFSWRRARTSANYVAPYWKNVTLNYLTNQYSVAYLLRF